MTPTTSMCGRLLALLLALLLAMPATVWAQDGAAAAAEYYNQATAAYQQGDYQKAADLLDLAFGADADLVYKYNRILALQALGDYQTALAELNALYTPMKADNQKRFDDIDAIKAQLEAAIESTDPQDPNPDPDPEVGVGDGTETTPASGGPNIPGIALTATGGVLFTTGILFVSAVFLPGTVKECLGIGTGADCTTYAQDRYGLANQETREFARDDAEGVRTTHVVAAVSLMAAGAIVGGIGVVLLVTGNKSDTEASAAPMSAGVDSLRFAPYVSHDGAGAALQMRF